MEAARDVRFKDFAGLQQKMAQLLEFDSLEEGAPVIGFRNGRLLVVCGETSELSEWAQTYGCWNHEGSKLLARHLDEGSILLRLKPEGAPDELHLIKPGKAQLVDVAKLLGF
jgi:hypothetical protein